MIVSRPPHKNEELYIDSSHIERVTKFKYLNDKWDNDDVASLFESPFALRVKTLKVQRIEALEMWILRRLLKISYPEHVTNEQLLDIVRQWKTSYLEQHLSGPKYNL